MTTFDQYVEERKIKMQAIAAARAKRKPLESASNEQTEVQRITDALVRANGDPKAAGKLINLSRATMFRKIKKLGINVNEIRGKATPATSTGTPVAEN